MIFKYNKVFEACNQSTPTNSPLAITFKPVKKCEKKTSQILHIKDQLVHKSQ